MDIRPLLALASDKVEREDASAAQPAVKDIHRRRRRLLEIDEHYKHAKILLCICESSTKKENKERKKTKINKINNERETGERAKRIKKIIKNLF